MKCPYCGSPLGLEDEFCSFCGQPNPYAQKHQEDMKHYKKEFAQTQQDVYTQTRRFASLTTPIIILFVLFLLNIGGVIFAASGWKIGMHLQEKEIIRHADEHRTNLEQFLQDEDYSGFAAYYNTNSLYSADEFDEYRAVVSVAEVYFSIYRMLADQSDSRSYYFDFDSISSTVHSLTLNLDTLFNVRQDFSYMADVCLTDEKMEHIANIQNQAKAILVTYGGLSVEEAEQLPDLSSSRQEELLKGGWANYEENSSQQACDWNIHGNTHILIDFVHHYRNFRN